MNSGVIESLKSLKSQQWNPKSSWWTNLEKLHFTAFGQDQL